MLSTATLFLEKGIARAALVLLIASISAPAFGQARVQAIHNSPYSEASLVDVYIGGTLVFDDFAFRDVEPFADLPSGLPLTIDITASDAPDNSSPVFSKTVTLDSDTYVLVAAGDPLERDGNPPFDLFVFSPGQETGSSTEQVDVLVFHGSPDAPAVDVPVRGLGIKAVDDLAFGSFTSSYASLPPSAYALGISVADDADESILATFVADLTGLGGGAAVVLASGFLAPGDGDPAFGLLAAFPDGTEALLTPVIPVSDARAVDDGTTGLAVEGVVTRARGRLTVLQDDSAGITVFQSSGSFRDAVDAGDIAAGDAIIVYGERSDFANYEELAPAGYIPLSSGNEVEPQLVTLADIASGGESYESELVRIVDLAIDAGGDTEFSSSTTYGISDASDQSGAVSLRTPSSSDTDIAGASIPTAATFVGIVGQFSFGAADEGYQLSPINASDIVAQTARVQIIHNSADAAAGVVDVYINDGLALDDFTFRSATPFIDLPAGVALDIALAPGTSTSSADAVATVPGVVFADGGSYIVTAAGLLGSTEAPFNLYVFDGGQESGVTEETVDALIFHGSPDAPAVDVVARLAGAKLADDLAFGNYIPAYASVAPTTYFVDIETADNTAVAASFGLEANGAAGEAGVVMASGFLAPQGDDAAFALLLVTPEGAVTELPSLAENVYAQVIHSAADPVADPVDVYLDGARILDDFVYQQATGFLFLPAEAQIGVTLGGNDTLGVDDPKFDVSLNAGSKYVIVASGLLGPSIPEVGFTLLAYEVDDLQGKRADVELLVVHAVTDAPAVDVGAGETTLVDAIPYADGRQLSVPEGSYVLDVTLDEGGALVESFSVDLTGAAGQFLTVLASGFVAPPDGSVGREFGLFSVDAEGNVGTPAIVTGVEDRPSEIPSEFSLDGNYPNPFNPTTNINFDLPESAQVSVQVFDVLGRQVLTLSPRSFGPGANQIVQIDAAGLSSGLYVYRVTAEMGSSTVAQVGQMTLLK